MPAFAEPNAGLRLNRTVWVVDAGFPPRDNRKALTQGGSRFIIAEKLRGNEAATVEARTRQGRFRTVDESLQVKDVRVGAAEARLNGKTLLCTSAGCRADRAGLQGTAGGRAGLAGP